MYNIRIAGLQDVMGLARIHVALWRECYPFIPEIVHRQRDVMQRADLWADRLSGGGRERTVILEAEGMIEGFGRICENIDMDVPGAHAELNALYLLPHRRRGGAGAKMAIELLGFAKIQGWSNFATWAFKGNPIRITYGALGLKPVVHRDRILSGIKIPETGFICHDNNRLEEMLTKIVNRSELSGGRTRNQRSYPARPRQSC